MRDCWKLVAAPTTLSEIIGGLERANRIGEAVRLRKHKAETISRLSANVLFTNESVHALVNIAKSSRISQKLSNHFAFCLISFVFRLRLNFSLTFYELLVRPREHRISQQETRDNHTRRGTDQSYAQCSRVTETEWNGQEAQPECHQQGIADAGARGRRQSNYSKRHHTWEGRAHSGAKCRRQCRALRSGMKRVHLPTLSNQQVGQW